MVSIAEAERSRFRDYSAAMLNREPNGLNCQAESLNLQTATSCFGRTEKAQGRIDLPPSWIDYCGSWCILDILSNRLERFFDTWRLIDAGIFFAMQIVPHKECAI